MPELKIASNSPLSFNQLTVDSVMFYPNDEHMQNSYINAMVGNIPELKAFLGIQYETGFNKKTNLFTDPEHEIHIDPIKYIKKLTLYGQTAGELLLFLIYFKDKKKVHCTLIKVHVRLKKCIQLLRLSPYIY